MPGQPVCGGDPGGPPASLCDSPLSYDSSGASVAGSSGLQSSQVSPESEADPKRLSSPLVEADSPTHGVKPSSGLTGQPRPGPLAGRPAARAGAGAARALFPVDVAALEDWLAHAERAQARGGPRPAAFRGPGDRRPARARQHCGAPAAWRQPHPLRV
jgi:hypothetical protein